MTVSDPFGTTQTTAEHLRKTVCDFLKGQFAPARCQRLRVRLGAEDIVKQTLDPLGMNTDFVRWDYQFLFVDKAILGFISLCWLDRQVCCTEDISDIFAWVEQGCMPVSSVTRDCFSETLDTDFRVWMARTPRCLVRTLDTICTRSLRLGVLD